MDTEILDLISNSSINGYYDSSLRLIVVWFHSMDDKSDCVAYLNKNMEWDLREVISEISSLYDDKEIIEITHRPVEVFRKDSEFDKALRRVLENIIKESLEKYPESPGLDMMKVVLDSNSYYNINN